MLNQRAEFDRTEEDLGNIVEFGHVNVCIPDQRLATIFYVSGLGLTRDPYLVTGEDNMWINVGREQFHLPTGAPQVVRGTTGIVVPHFATQIERLERVRPLLGGTRFSFSQGSDFIEATCPWGNRIRCHEPDVERYGNVGLGIAYVAIETPKGSAPAIARFYEEMLGAKAGLGETKDGAFAWVVAGAQTKLHFQERDGDSVAFDGHHIQISLNDFSQPHRRLMEAGLITEESNQHQYRFVDIVDIDRNRPLLRLEHEVRSMRHPMFGRVLANRDPDVSNLRYAPGHEVARQRIRAVETLG